MYKVGLVGLVFACGLSSSFCASAETWTFRSDAWCPYNCAPEDKNPGYLVEILQGAAKAHGHQVDYQVLPYSRALKQAQEGRITRIVGMLALAEREGFIFSQAVGMDSNCFFVNKGSRQTYRSTADFDKLGRIGIIQGYGYPDEFMRWSSRNSHKVEAMTGDDGLVRQARKLKLNRLGAFIENENVFRYASTHSPELHNIEMAGCMPGGDPLFIGFSSKGPHASRVKAQVDAYLVTIRQNGELAKLLDKYQVALWK